MPGLPVRIPDMVYFEVTQDLARIGAEDVVLWARGHPDQVHIIPTVIFSEFQTLRDANPALRSRGRGEQAALEVLNAEVARDPQIEALLLYEDNDVRSRSFVRILPERAIPLSTGDLLHELEAAGRIQSSDHIRDRAAGKEPNIEAQRARSQNDVAGDALRRHLTRAPGGKPER